MLVLQKNELSQINSERIRFISQTVANQHNAILGGRYRKAARAAAVTRCYSDDDDDDDNNNNNNNNAK